LRVPRLVLLLVAAALVSTAVAGLPLGAQEGDSPDPKSQDELRAAIGEASLEETAALAQLAAIRERRALIEAQARELEAKFADATVRLQQAEAEVARLDALLVPIRAEVERLEGEIAASRKEFENAAASLYRNAGNGEGILHVLRYTRDARSMVSTGRYLEDVSNHAEEEIDEFSALKADLDDAKQELEKQLEAAKHARAAVDAERAEVERLRAELEPARAALDAEEAAEREIVAGIQARKGEFEAQLAALIAEQEALARAVSRGSGKARGSGNGRLKWPCDGSVVSGFGFRTHPISGTRRMHTGVDISCANGAPISAAGDGVVTEAGWRGGYGLAVVIDHGDGLATLYGHQSRIAASGGQRVGTGEVIGYVGSTGYSTGPHLHWEVWVNGNPVDPMGYS
jgi:murein DD-endopeptidase MepM/ murein hydrolase activator NlpD